MALVAFAAEASGGTGPGTGFGEAVRLEMGAPRAATGGLPMEEYSARGVTLNADQFYLGDRARWFGVGLDSRVTGGVRAGGSVHQFSVEGARQAFENADGSYGGEGDGIGASELGWKAFVQLLLPRQEQFTLGLRATVQGLSQEVAGWRGSGLAGNAEMVGERPLTERSRFLGWMAAGPFGASRSSSFAWSARAGAAIERRGGVYLARGSEGFRAGLEAERLGESLLQVGAGMLYWFGGDELEGDGARLVLRAGARREQSVVVENQFRGGVGFRFNGTGGFGWGLDYAYVPFGLLGQIHYMSVSVTFGRRITAIPLEEWPGAEGTEL
jgi:hypothetical protein